MKHDKSYSCVVMLVFIKNIDKESCSSMKQLMLITDKLGEKLGYKTNIGYDSKLAIINDMIKRGILIKLKRGLTQPVTLNPKVKDYILESLSNAYVVTKEQ